MKLNWLLKYGIFLIVILCIVSRSSQLFSENLVLDGDEAIVGLMSKHFLELKEVPFFFYGQSYGFSFIEVSVISLFYFIFGISEIAVKLAMLCLWTTGIVFFYKTLKAIGFKNNAWIPLLITLIFIFSPSFAVWSMKARGGYLTAFLLSSVVTFLLFNKKQPNLITSFSIGFLIVLIYQSQALWLAGLLPLVAFSLYQSKQFRYYLLMFSGIIIGSLLFYFLKIGLPTFWSPKIIGFPAFTLENFSHILDRMYIHFTGNYFYDSFEESILITKLLSIGLISATFISIITGIVFLFRKKEVNPLLYAILISVLCSFGYVLIISSLGFRYFLPITGFALILIAFILNQFESRKIINSLLIAWILLGTISLYDFKNYSYEDKKAIIELVDQLEEREISHVYCEGALLQWQIMFYSKEKTIARYISNIDRYPAYITTVDSTYKNDTKSVALVGYYHEYLAENLNDFTGINQMYYMQSPADKSFLIERNFDLSQPPSKE